MHPSSADEAYMRRCLQLAAEAAARDEVPIGALVVVDGIVVGEGSNRCEELANPLAHAELEALAAAFKATKLKRLVGATLFCTLEPCFMCAGALMHARVGRLVYGARDPKFGACGSLANLLADPRANHRCPVHEGVLAAESAALLRGFFRPLR